MNRKTHVYGHRPGRELRADVYFSESPGRLSPVVLWLHGGALIFGTRQDIPGHYVSQLVRKGFTVVSIDYGLAPDTKLPGIFDDVSCAYAWILKELPALYPIDTSRIAVMGQSAGGYLSLLAGQRFTPRPRALVSIYGYGSISGDWYSRPSRHYCAQPLVSREQALASVSGPPFRSGDGRGRFDFYLYCRQTGRWPVEVVGVDPAHDLDYLRSWSPVDHTDALWPPSLLLHGVQDTDVPFEESARMAETLRQWGAKHRLVKFVGAGHGFDLQSTGPDTLDALSNVSDFLDENV